MRVFLQAIFGQIICNFYIIMRTNQAIPPSKKWRIPFILFFVAELSLYFCGFFFHNDLPDAIWLRILLICNTWYIASIFISLCILLLDLVRLTNHFHPWYPAWIKNHWQKTKYIILITIVTGITGLLIKAYHNANYPVVKHLHISIPKEVNGRDSLTIALMSDTHFGEIIGKNHARRMVDLCNAQHPDMVVLAGDILDYESFYAEHEHIEDELRQIQAPLGVYITLGNHEYRVNKNAKIKWLEKTGGILLIDSTVMPDTTFYLIGRDDAINRRRMSLHALMQGTDPNKPIIVVDHQPVAIHEILMNKADLCLMGHTHNGQFWPYSYLLRLKFEMTYGYYHKGGSQFYVSSGIGYSGIPYRIGTQSELVVLHITFGKEK